MSLPLDPFLPHLPGWLLVLFRLGGIFVFAPVLASKAIPTQVKVFWVLGLSFCIYPTLIAPGSPTAASIAPAFGPGFSLLQLPIAVAAEIFIGVLIGYGASLPLIAMQTAGHMVDQQMGLGLGELYNPDMEEQTGAFGSLYYMTAFTLFVALDGHRIMLATLLNTFEHVPLTSFNAYAPATQMVVGLLNAMFEVAMRISGPLLALVFLETLAMGFLSKTVPQLNILNVGFPTRILVGVGLLIASFAVEAQVFVDHMREVLQVLQAFWVR